MKKSASIAIMCVTILMAGSKFCPTQAEDVFPTDSQIMTFNLGEHTISLPMTQNGEPSVNQYEDRLIARGTPGKSTFYGYSRPTEEAAQLKVKVAKYYSNFRKNENGQYEAEEIGIYLSAERMQKIKKQKEIDPNSAIAFRIGNTFPDAESKAIVSNYIQSYQKWFYEAIKPMKSDELDMAAPTFEQADTWIKKYHLPNYFAFSRVSNQVADFTSIGQPLIFDSTCNPDLQGSPDPYYGFCRVRFYWKVDMLVTFDFDPIKLPREKWRQKIHDVYAALDYLEQPKK